MSRGALVAGPGGPGCNSVLRRLGFSSSRHGHEYGSGVGLEVTPAEWYLGARCRMSLECG